MCAGLLHQCDRNPALNSEIAMNRFLLVYRFASAWREGIKKLSQRIFAAIVAAAVMGLFIGGSAAAGKLETLLREDLEALVFVRLPQLPSSRAFGSFPGASIGEYMKRVPEDKSQWKVVPVERRPFPQELIEPDTLSDAPLPLWALALGGFVQVAGALSIRSICKRRSRESELKVI